MGKIKNTSRYPINDTPTPDDFVIGTKSSDGTTVNFNLASIGLSADNAKFKVVNATITSAEQLDIFNTPKVLIPAQGPGNIIYIESIIARVNFNTVPYNYSENDGGLNFRTEGDFSANLMGHSVNNTNVTITRRISVGQFVLIENDNFIATVNNINHGPTEGDGTIDLQITYRVITL